MSISGINRGFLFGVGSSEPFKDYVYVASPTNLNDPFTNPKLTEVFDQSEVIVSEFKEPSEKQEATSEAFLKAIPDLLNKAIAPQELQTITKTLLPMLNQITDAGEKPIFKDLKPFIQHNQDPAKTVAALFLGCLINVGLYQHKQANSQSPQKSPSMTSMVQELRNRAVTKQKTIVPLGKMDELDTQTLIDQFSTLFLQTPQLLHAILSVSSQKQLLPFFLDGSTLERGDYDECPDTEAKQKIIESFLEQKGFDLEKLNNSCRELYPVIQLGKPKQSDTAQKVAQFIKNDQRHLFLISRDTLDNWPRQVLPLTQIKIPLKPIGFMWIIKDSSGKEGYLLGSMHLTAQKLVNFPSKILQYFYSSDALAVEIDITREDVIKKVAKFCSWEVIQAKELSLLSSEDKAQLYQFMKNVFPLSSEESLQNASLDSYDKETLFLVHALRTMRSMQWKKQAANMNHFKDEETNQSLVATGIEVEFFKRAKEKQMPIKDLESFEDHFIKLAPDHSSASLIPIMTIQELQELVKFSKKTEEELYNSLISSHLELNSPTIAHLFSKNPLQQMTETMEKGDLEMLEVDYMQTDKKDLPKLIQRNLNIALKIHEFIQTGKKHFCMAGAMHMAGPSSILSFLKQFGYTLERVIAEEPL